MSFLTVRDISVVARRTNNDGHDLVDMSAFNTDGVDVAGHDIHIHDVVSSDMETTVKNLCRLKRHANY